MGNFPSPRLRSVNSFACSSSARWRAKVVSKTCSNPRASLQNVSTRRRIRERSTAWELLEDTEAASEARLCGAIESTGILCDGVPRSGLLFKALRTSVCDCRVIKTDSAEVMQPLDMWCQICTVHRANDCAPTCKTVIQTNLRCLKLLPGLLSRWPVRRDFVV